MGFALGVPQIVVLLLAVQRLAELRVANRNTRRLLAQGGREVGRAHYPLFIVLHSAWLAALFFLIPADAPVVWPLVALLVLLQVGRYWVIHTLGPYWTTRIITLPQAPLIQGGPFRWIRHPNYCVVVAEIAAVPLAFGAWQLALAFSIANALLLTHRIRVEEAALAPRRGVVPQA
ncbi:isoprenylcysteine carboxyl methyltransferase family protein [Nitrospirillum amazonense]|uniref:Methyltransferase n=1 Tax=Nitrospirillum amazonense TaxID=28077 RepID=A0A560KAW2_9PROT|nr:isoprenylcysteine carboxylmethyltransferase family protein [Nitrospirillum amazonense]MDG3441351.1 isoprenylcysteine carboxylmethyltransferase family protein [Nitrospirillum amazonense]TWB80159.1 methyltransferase [Nitrospirillum amazonense]